MASIKGRVRVTRGSELMSNLWLIFVPVILIVALVLFFRLTKKS